MTENEKTVLLEYLASGGHLLLTTDLDAYSAEAMPNFAEIAAAYGLEAEEGLLFESSGYYYNYPYNLILQPNASHPIIGQLPTSNISVTATSAHGIKETGEGTATITPLLTTSDTSFLKKNFRNIQTAEREDGDIDGPFYVGVSSVDETTGASLIWLSTPILELDITGRQYGGLSVVTDVDVWKTNAISISGKLRHQTPSSSPTPCPMLSAP